MPRRQLRICRWSVDDVSADDLSVDDLFLDDLSLDDLYVDCLSVDCLSVDDVSVEYLFDLWIIYLMYSRCETMSLFSCFACRLALYMCQGGYSFTYEYTRFLVVYRLELYYFSSLIYNVVASTLCTWCYIIPLY